MKIKCDCRGMSEDEIIDSIFKSRGINNPIDFLSGANGELPLTDLVGIEDAANYILNAADANARILIHADVDVDGISSATIMYKYLRHLGCDNLYVYINKGKDHGVLKFDAESLKTNKIDLMIVVDSIEDTSVPYENIVQTGTTLIVIDHHIISKELANSCLDMTLVSSANQYGNSQLSGSGVTWKVCKMMDYLRLDNYAERLTDLAACGIIADMCSVGPDSLENRAICRRGFLCMNAPVIKGIVGKYEWNSQAVSYSIAPMTNAAMRTGHNDDAIDLFLADNQEDVEEMIPLFNMYKEEQSEKIRELLPELVEQCEQQINDKCMVVINNGTVTEVGGVVANKLVEKYQRPVLVLKAWYEYNNDTGELVGEPEYRGSARGIGVKNFKEIFDKTYIGWSAGHENAFGCGIPMSSLDDFKRAIEELLKDIEFSEEIECDVWIDKEQLTPSLAERLKMINRISGAGFQPIRVCLKDVANYKVSYMSNGKHLKVNVPGLSIVEWNSNTELPQKGTFDVCGVVDVNEYFGRKNVQIVANNFIIGETA